MKHGWKLLRRDFSVVLRIGISREFQRNKIQLSVLLRKVMLKNLLGGT